MSFTELELKDICLDMHQGINTVADKVEYRSKGIPIIQSKNITSGYLDLDDVRYLDIDDYEKYKDKYNPNKGDILLCNIGTIGTSLVLKQDSKFLIAWNLFKLKIDTERFNPKYIKYYLDKLKLINYFDKLLTGGTVKFINKTKMGQIRIPICDIRKQDKIVSVLDKAQELIDKRKEQIEALDELVKSKFIEMFSEVNEYVRVSEYIESLTAGKSLAGESECKNKVLNTGSISYDYFDMNQVKNLPNDYIPKEEHLVNVGDVLISRMNTSELVGATAYVWNVNPNTYIPDRLWKANFKPNCNPIFVWQLLIQNSTKEKIRRIASGTSGSMKNISKLGLLGIEVIKVDIEKQNEFANFVKQVDKLKFEMEKSLKELEDNFNSLMQKAFKGELFN